MKAYLVKMIFQVHGGEKAYFDEQWRIVNGSDKEAVLEKSYKLGLSEEETIQRVDGTQSRWEFVAITDVIEMNHETDGAFVFSHTTEPDHAERYIHSIKLRAEHFQTITLAK